MSNQFVSLRVERVDALCADAVAVTFDVPGEIADRFAFRAGQSVTVRRTVAGREERRSYSICAPEGLPPRIGVREVDGGLISPWLVRELVAGDRVEVAPPTGTFALAGDTGGRHVL